MRWVGGVVLALAALAGFALAGSGTTSDRQRHRPSIILVTIDTLRADRLRPDGPMPRLAALARTGTRFDRAYSHVPLTLPSHASILTGRAPLHHGVSDNVGEALSASVPTLAEALSRAGWATGAFVGGVPLARASGLDRGFDRYDDRMTRSAGGASSGQTERPASEVVRASLAWLATVPPSRPYFLWAHFYDPHDPYEAPPPYRGQHGSPYDDEVAYADAALGSLLDGARAISPHPVWIVVTADHGESLGEHGERTHGVFLYDSTLHVPLVIRSPSAFHGRIVGDPVALSDLAPTLLDMADVPAMAGATGRSLRDAILQGSSLPPVAIYLESVHGRRRYGWSPLYGLLDWPMKLIQAPRPELYDLAEDGGETDNMWNRRRASELRVRLDGMRRDAALPAGVPADAGDEIVESLASLGYVGGFAGMSQREVIDDRKRPDPKDRIACLSALENGLAALTAGDDDAAEGSLRDALQRDPDNLVALNNLGILMMRRGRLADAESWLRKGARRDPAADTIQNNLGLVLSQAGRPSEAIGAYRAALRSRPGFTAARFNLALALFRAGRAGDALGELERVRAEDPGFPDLDETIARVRSIAERVK